MEMRSAVLTQGHVTKCLHRRRSEDSEPVKVCPAPAPRELNILSMRVMWGMQYLTPGHLQVQSLFL